MYSRYPNWAFVKSEKISGPNNTGREAKKKKNSRTLNVIPYVAKVSEKLRWIFSKHDILVHFKPKNRQTETLVHPEGKIPEPKLSGFVNAVQRRVY